MIKSIVPKEQPFSELASGQFFTIGIGSDRLYQKTIEVDGPNVTPYNTIVVTEQPVGQRGNSYGFGLVYFHEDVMVSHIEVAKIEILIRPKAVI